MAEGDRVRPGERVGALLAIDRKHGVAQLIGYGVYQGRHVPKSGDSDVPGGVLGAVLAEEGIANPQILLDNGVVVWGCECWWGPEAEIRGLVAECDRVEAVDIRALRAEAGSS